MYGADPRFQSILRVSDKYIVKISDFGLSRDIYRTDYYRLEDREGAPLPIKWLALESLRSGVFDSKTDMVRLMHPLISSLLYNENV